MIAALFLSVAPAVAQPIMEEPMKLYRNGTQPSQKGPADWFTGAVRIDPLNTAPAPARHGAARVTFEPGARTAWHTHPLGQTLIVTSGVGWTQCEGEPIVEIRAGDVVWCPPGHRHWHGASPTTAMTHIAVQEALDGKMVEWMEHVTDEEYLAGSPQSADVKR
ncbi:MULTISPECIES: cupin domain-containing protein [unclassified Phenylobacterium]|uniref:(R)-mandelonitrile lyase n=1 Tax=unclassified Phenylobacterium TaxID=2640670 RepID=UPI001F37C36D|nr:MULTISPECIES: cupin domain-containing protein [unclassified Phenylobacterium]